MAGSERSGPLAASAALFDGRPWAVTPHDDVRSRRRSSWSRRWPRLCGAVPVRLSPVEHDRRSPGPRTCPHLLAALAAGRLADAPADHLALSGQGVRDVTRVAAGDPALYGQIVAANADAVAATCSARCATSWTSLIDAVGGGDRAALEALLRGGRGRHPRDPRQARRAGPADRVGLRLRARPSRASWPGCSPTPAPARSTSRTSASTTTPAARSGWSSCWSRRPAPSTCWPLSNPGVG